jgi:hypothetical protein
VQLGFDGQAEVRTQQRRAGDSAQSAFWGMLPLRTSLARHTLTMHAGAGGGQGRTSLSRHDVRN